VRVTLGVDALSPSLSGIGRYTWELCKGLDAHHGIGDLRFYRQNGLIDRPEQLLRHDNLLRHSKLIRRWQAWRTRQQLRSSLFHGPNYFLPPAAERGVITVHDLSVLLYPETHPVERVRAFEAAFLPSIERAAHIITDTETVRAELLEHLSVAPERVTAIHLGVDESFSPKPERASSADLQYWELVHGSYGLCVSTLEPRKKIAELIAAWSRLPEAVRSRFPLVLAGGAGWRNEAISSAIERGRVEGWLRYLGFVDETQLTGLYSGARLFVYPSIYEGFGLPPLEALASGVPVLVADRSCLPEVCGPAARYLDPDDQASFTAAIHEGLEDLQWQVDARQSGPARAAQFRWQHCVDRTVDVYAQVLGGAVAAPSRRALLLEDRDLSSKPPIGMG
jgi:alpha-1,3-rhamnosyl/mannosyltransferase